MVFASANNLSVSFPSAKTSRVVDRDSRSLSKLSKAAVLYQQYFIVFYFLEAAPETAAEIG